MGILSLVLFVDAEMGHFLGMTLTTITGQCLERRLDGIQRVAHPSIAITMSFIRPSCAQQWRISCLWWRVESEGRVIA